MRGKIESSHVEDVNGNPAGGSTTGIGFSILWQNGPLVDPATGERHEQSGAFVEDVIEAVVDRIMYYQRASERKFACRENALAITKLEEALHWLNARTADRERRGVEGTHEA